MQFLCAYRLLQNKTQNFKANAMHLSTKKRIYFFNSMLSLTYTHTRTILTKSFFMFLCGQSTTYKVLRCCDCTNPQFSII